MLSVRLKQIVFPVVMVSLMVYFTYHIFQGQRGVIAWIQLDKKLKEQQLILDQLTAEKAALEKEAYLLRPDSLDLDLLVEKVRHSLNFAHPDEVSVVVENKS
jgi:cell division protein FtsB